MHFENRPAHLDDWLDTLPYANPEKCLQLMESALLETNKAAIKANIRLELMELYWSRYRFLLDSKVRGPAQTAGSGGSQRGNPIASLKAVALEIARGCKPAVKEADTPKSLFRTGKPPTRAALLAMTAYSHALLLGFQQYAPAPKDIWRDLHELFEIAESGEFLDEQLPDPDGRNNAATSLRRVYARTCACALVDPHHLDAGQIWLVYMLAADSSLDLAIAPFKPLTDSSGVFVIDLHMASAPVSYRKLKLERTTPHLRLLYCEKLAQRCRAELGQTAGQTQSGLLDKNASRIRLLEYAMRAWSDTPYRQRQRDATNGAVDVVIGIIDIHALVAATGQGAFMRVATESWRLLNAGSEGFALHATGRPPGGLRVGDLLALRAGAGGWSLAAVRWLMIESATMIKVGAQIIARSATAVRLCAKTGPDILTQPRSGLLLEPADAGQPHTLATSPGLYAPGARLELTAGAQRQDITVAQLVERTIAFERFSYTG